MELTDILTLAKAGFNATQISALASVQASAPIPGSVPAAVPAAVQASAPATAPAAVQASAPATAPATAPAAATVDDVMRELGLLQGTIQKSAILGAEQPKQESVDDILASIINPPESK